EHTFKLMVVLKLDKYFLAFCIDEVLGIAKASSADIQKLKTSNPDVKSYYKGILAQNGQFISVLDIETLFALPDVYAITRPQVTDTRTQEAKRTPMLVFEAGSALFSVPAVEVYAAVPRQDIKQTAITGGKCLGEISYYNRRIPIICPIETFGVGDAHKHAQSQIVVLNFPDNKLLGLAVDSVQTIEGFSRTQSSELPIWLKDDCYIQSVTIRSDHNQVFELDIEALRESKSALTLASLSDPAQQKKAQDQQTSGDVSANDVVHEREKYLVVKAGEQLAIPLEDVSYILEPPDTITPAPMESLGFDGYFSRFGQTVALFDLRSMMGGSNDEDLTRILLTGEKDKQVAFWVEKVVGIETSQWRETKAEGSNTNALVKMVSKEERSVMPYLSLQTILPDPVATPPTH
ncbi:MAG: chemotaxis protein CheW, partial [Paracoccaceae bacterium]